MLLLSKGHQLSAQRSPHEVIRRSDGESIHVTTGSNMHGSSGGDSSRREYIRRGDVLVPGGHVGIDGQDGLVIQNSIMDDGQVGSATSPPFFIPHLMVRVCFHRTGF